MSKDTCKTYYNFKNDTECIKWLENGSIDANNQHLKTLSEFCVGDNLKKEDCIDNCSKIHPTTKEPICAKSIIDYCEQKNKYFPLEPILEDDICYSFCSTTQDTALKSRCDNSISKSCNLVYPQKGSSNSNCDCFYEQNTKIGKDNLDKEKVEPEIRNLGVVCVLSSCKGSGYKTETLKESATNCPPCVQLNGINQNIGGVSNVIQNNTCTVIKTTTEGGNTSTSGGGNTSTSGSGNTSTIGSSTLNLDDSSSTITPNILNISIVAGVFFITTFSVAIYVTLYDKKSSPLLKFFEVVVFFVFWGLIIAILYFIEIFSIKHLDPDKIIDNINSISNINNDEPEINNNCPAGFYCSSGEMSSAVECKIGSYCKSGTSSEMNCPYGFYCSIPSKKVACPKGYYCKEERLTSLKESNKCPIGHYCDKGGNWPPVKCHPGYYCTKTGMSLEVECPIGYYCPTGADKNPILCPRGYYCYEKGISSLGTKYKCPAGKYCPNGGNSTPINCPVGNYCPGGDYEPIKCEQGQYQNQNGQASCKNISEGYYVTSPSDEQKQCPKDFYCPGGKGGLIKCQRSTWRSDNGLLTTDLGSTSSSYIWNPTTIVDGRINSSYENACKIPAGSYCGSSAAVYALSSQCETNCCRYNEDSGGYTYRKCLNPQSGYPCYPIT